MALGPESRFDASTVARRQRGRQIGAFLAAATVALGLCASPASAAPAAEKRQYLVFSQCKPGLQAQCATWYAKHLRDITRIEGIDSAQEYRAVSFAGGPSMSKDRLIVYQIHGDPAAVLARLRPAVTAGQLERPDAAMFEMPFQSVIVEAVGPEVKAGR